MTAPREDGELETSQPRAELYQDAWRALDEAGVPRAVESVLALHVTPPRWIQDALDAVLSPPEVTAHGDAIAAAMIDRLPIEAIAAALRGIVSAADPAGRNALDHEAAIAAIVRAMTDDAEVVTLAEWYQAAARELDAAGVPYAASAGPDTTKAPLDLAGRIRWLAAQRPIKLAERDHVRAALGVLSAELNAALRDRDAYIEALELEIAELEGDVFDDREANR